MGHLYHGYVSHNQMVIAMAIFLYALVTGWLRTDARVNPTLKASHLLTELFLCIADSAESFTISLIDQPKVRIA